MVRKFSFREYGPKDGGKLVETNQRRPNNRDWMDAKVCEVEIEIKIIIENSRNHFSDVRNEETNPPFTNCRLAKIISSNSKWGLMLKINTRQNNSRFEVLSSREGGLPSFGSFSSFWPRELQSGNNCVTIRQ